MIGLHCVNHMLAGSFSFTLLLVEIKPVDANKYIPLHVRRIINQVKCKTGITNPNINCAVIQDQLEETLALEFHTLDALNGRNLLFLGPQWFFIYVNNLFIADNVNIVGPICIQVPATEYEQDETHRSQPQHSEWVQQRQHLKGAEKNKRDP